MEMKKYYFIDKDIDSDIIYGSERPICIDAEEIERLNEEWSTNLFEIMHEASADEIEKHGVYDS